MRNRMLRIASIVLAVVSFGATAGSVSTDAVASHIEWSAGIAIAFSGGFPSALSDALYIGATFVATSGYSVGLYYAGMGAVGLGLGIGMGAIFAG